MLWSKKGSVELRDDRLAARSCGTVNPLSIMQASCSQACSEEQHTPKTEQERQVSERRAVRRTTGCRLVAWCLHALRRIAMSWNGWGWSWQQQNWGTLLCMFMALTFSGHELLQKRSGQGQAHNSACTSSLLSACSSETLGGATTGGRGRPSRSSALFLISYLLIPCRGPLQCVSGKLGLASEKRELAVREHVHDG